jgi:hypothetical protein
LPRPFFNKASLGYVLLQSFGLHSAKVSTLFIDINLGEKIKGRSWFVAIFLLLVMMACPALAGKKKDPPAGLSPAEEAGMRLLTMQSKGLIQLSVGEPITFMLVEPLN